MRKNTGPKESRNPFRNYFYIQAWSNNHQKPSAATLFCALDVFVLLLL